MRFTIETEPFFRMLQMLGQARPFRRRRFAPLRLETIGGLLRAQYAGLTAEIEAMVWREGGCVLSAPRLREAIALSLEHPTLLVRAEDDRLVVGDIHVPCATEHLPVSSRPASRIFFASQVGVVASDDLMLSAFA